MTTHIISNKKGPSPEEVYSILLVEDDDIDYQNIKRIFTSANMNSSRYQFTIKARSTSLASTLEHLHKETFDIILLDLILPDAREKELVKTILDSCHKKPLVILTGMNQDEKYLTEMIQLGVQDYISKNNLSHELLVKTILFAIERNKLNLKIQQQSNELEQKSNEQRLFTHLISHDLRSPCYKISSFQSLCYENIQSIESALVKEGVPAGPWIEDLTDTKDLLAGIERSTEKITTLAERILQLAKTGTHTVRCEKVDLDTLVTNCISYFQSADIPQNLTFTKDSFPVICSDLFCVERIFYNLIDNSIKYLDPQRPGKIHIGFSKESSKYYKFYVEDNGLGMSEEDQKKLFSESFRGRNAQKIYGSGLGLFLIHSLTKKLSGTISCTSTLDQGTKMMLSFPKKETTEIAA